MTNKVSGSLEMTAAMVISGTIGWFVLVSGQPVLDVVFWRCVFGAATLLVVCAGMGLLRAAITWRLLALAALGGVAIVLNWLLLFVSYSHASISISTAVYNTQPFMLVGLGAVFFSERLTINKLTWLAIAFAGMLLIVLAQPGGADSGAYGGSDYLAGILMALGAAFFYAVAAIITKKLARFSMPPHLIALIQVCVGMAMLAPFAHLSQLPTAIGTWSILVTVGVVHTGLMYILLYGAIQKLPTHLTGSLSFIYPIVAIMVDFLAFGHRLQISQLIGAAAILIAAAGMNLGWSLWKPKECVGTS
ncbi:EamA domain-containing membrane protein RarD [Collimonas sp. OK242]|jgi:drug/metabolite transporter (DMT)-like permease|uniref:DMT family transporter n=1 Tax=Collimonas sp. OK242 TaxID=1798195 RepID=UPI000898BA45|nr:DMT family transporter [Collimonas sp. OK242]SDY14465.1 EamA domain-containing membrane protein RarD [Collimonas sp. OK242]